MKRAAFDWDPQKDQENRKKHGVSFLLAQEAFKDPCRVIAQDYVHSSEEERFYCFGKVTNGILTVRFSYRTAVIRIIGAGFWRKGKAIYDRENKIQR